MNNETAIAPRITPTLNVSTTTDKKQLRELLTRSMGITLNALIESAAIIKRLEELGDDLSDLRDSCIPNLRKIACGQLHPEVYRRLFGRPSILNRVASLPIPDQEMIAKGKPIEVSVVHPDGRMDSTALTLAEDMEPLTAQQVFAPGKIRNQVEQIAWLRARSIPRPRPAGPAVSLDRKRKGIHCESHSFVSLADMRDYVEQLEG